MVRNTDHTVAIENAALRMQLAAFQRKRKRPVLTAFDRLFWITLRSLWSEWRRPLFYVQADTVVRWNRERFRRFWPRLSRPGAPRIHGELKMLGIAISERTVSRILRRLRRPSSQTWKTFLHNHLGQM